MREYAENWNEKTDYSEKIAHKVAFNGVLGRICCEETGRARQLRIDELSFATGEKARFLLSFSFGWQTCVSPQEMTLCAWRHSKGSLGSVGGLDGREAGPAPPNARRACTHWRIVATTCELALTFFLWRCPIIVVSRRSRTCSLLLASGGNCSEFCNYGGRRLARFCCSPAVARVPPQRL